MRAVYGRLLVPATRSTPIRASLKLRTRRVVIFWASRWSGGGRGGTWVRPWRVRRGKERRRQSLKGITVRRLRRHVRGSTRDGRRGLRGRSRPWAGRRIRIYLALCVNSSRATLTKLISNIEGGDNRRCCGPRWLYGPPVITTDASPEGRTCYVIWPRRTRRWCTRGGLRRMGGVRVGMHRRVRVMVRRKGGQRRGLGWWMIVNMDR